MTLPLAPKQLEFIVNSTAKWNFAHGSVRSGKTVGTLFRFMQAVNECRDSQIWMIGKTSTTIFDNAINLILTSPQFAIFRPFCTWHKGDRILLFRDKEIKTIGAINEGAVGIIQGKTMSIVYCDEMTLYPTSIIDMIDTRLSNPWSIGFGSMNPSYPSHILKQWIDKGKAGDKNYYSLHFTLDDNPYVDKDYKDRIKSSSGMFYKRNYLGLWCLAEGSIFDFFDRNVHVVNKPPRCAEYWIAGVDVGTSNAFGCVLIGVNTGNADQTGRCLWVEKEYYWNSSKQGRTKTNAEYAEDLHDFLFPYGVKQIYIDPSAAAFKADLRKHGYHPIDANNDVFNGIGYLTNEVRNGNLYICKECPNLIREMESYVWDAKASEKGEDKPMKKDDHLIDALRYAICSHKITSYDYQAHAKVQQQWLHNKYQVTRTVR
jgi:PBSX family phage terminase large subunit